MYIYKKKGKNTVCFYVTLDIGKRKIGHLCGCDGFSLRELFELYIEPVVPIWLKCEKRNTSPSIFGTEKRKVTRQVKLKVKVFQMP